MRLSLSTLVLTGLGACGVPSGTPVLDAAAWVEDASLDPLPAHRTTEASCLPLGIELELGGIEVHTGDCPYAVLTQPVLVDVRQGRSITLLAWHNDLIAPEPSTGHLLLTVGDQTLIDWTPAIPSGADIVDDMVALPSDIRAGDMAVLHLHNHGANTWNLNAVEVGE